MPPASKIVQKTIKDKSILNAFQGLLGNNGANVEILFPKIARLIDYLSTLDTLFTALKDEPFITANIKTEFINWHLDYSYNALECKFTANPDAVQSYSKLFMHFNAYRNACKARNVSAVEGAPVAVEMAATLTEDDLKDIGTSYAEFKKDTLINTYITICRNLSIYKTQIRDDGTGAFLATIPGIEFAPLVFTRLNFKNIYVMHHTQPDVCTALITTLRDIYAQLMGVYRIISSPDVDVDKFSQIIIDNLGELKKQIPRCDLAFNKIEESLELLKSNFDGYYRTFVITKNPGSLIEGFIMDVSNSTKTSPQLSRQFRQIISHYRKRTNSNTDPKVQELLNNLEENFSMNSDTDPPLISTGVAATIVTPPVVDLDAIAAAALVKAAKRRRKRESQRDRALASGAEVAATTL